MIVVGVCRVVLALHGNSSLKGKRAVVRRVVDRTRHKFNVAIYEGEDQDEHGHAVIAFSVVGNEKPHVNSRIDTILNFMDGISEAPIAESDMEILSW